MWHRIIGFLLVNPGSAKVGLPGLAVSSYCLFNHKLELGLSDTDRLPSNSFLGPAHVLSHVSIHLGHMMPLHPQVVVDQAHTVKPFEILFFKVAISVLDLICFTVLLDFQLCHM